MFTRFKVRGILKRYEEVWAQIIPSDTIAREEIIALKHLQLEELAFMYDSLEGWKYYGSDRMPALSCYVPELEKLEPATNKIQILVRKIRFARDMKGFQYGELIGTRFKIVLKPANCWKTLQALACVYV